MYGVTLNELLERVYNESEIYQRNESARRVYKLLSRLLAEDGGKRVITDKDKIYNGLYHIYANLDNIYASRRESLTKFIALSKIVLGAEFDVPTVVGITKGVLIAAGLNTDEIIGLYESLCEEAEGEGTTEVRADTEGTDSEADVHNDNESDVNTNDVEDTAKEELVSKCAELMVALELQNNEAERLTSEVEQLKAEREQLQRDLREVTGECDDLKAKMVLMQAENERLTHELVAIKTKQDIEAKHESNNDVAERQEGTEGEIESDKKQKPWEEMGISYSTYYRRRKAGLI